MAMNDKEYLNYIEPSEKLRLVQNRLNALATELYQYDVGIAAGDPENQIRRDQLNDSFEGLLDMKNEAESEVNGDNS